MVTADGGKSWAQAALQEPMQSKAFTRFRAPWRWGGGPAVLQSRAWDEAGNVQPTRANRCRARRDQGHSQHRRLRKPALQRADDLGGRGQRTGEACLRIDFCSDFCSPQRCCSPSAEPARNLPVSAGRSARAISRPGISQHPWRRHRPASGQRTPPGARRQDLCRERLRNLPWRRRQRRPQRPAGRAAC